MHSQTTTPNRVLLNEQAIVTTVSLKHVCFTYSHAVSVLESIEDFRCVPVPYLKSTREALLT